MSEIINEWITTIVALVFGTGGGLFFAKIQKRKSSAEADISEGDALQKMRDMYNVFLDDYQKKFASLQIEYEEKIKSIHEQYEAKITNLNTEYLKAVEDIKDLRKTITRIEKRCEKCTSLN